MIREDSHVCGGGQLCGFLAGVYWTESLGPRYSPGLGDRGYNA